MSDLKTDTVTNDISLVNGDLVFNDGIDAITQFCRARLKTFLGEWFLDLSVGVPYFEDILKKNPDPFILDGVFKDAILSCPGILQLTSFELSFNGAIRRLTVNWSATTSEGEVSFSEELP